MAIQLLVRCAPTLTSKASYTLETFLDTLGLPYRLALDPRAIPPEDLVIAYGSSDGLPNTQPIVEIPCSPASVEYFRRLQSYDPLHVRWIPWDPRSLPVLFSSRDEPMLHAATTTHAVIRHDIVMSAFFFLSCWQEGTTASRDQFGRFPYEASLQARLGITQQPIVAEYLRVLRTALDQVAAGAHQTLEIAPWWGGQAGFAVCLTHDVHRLATDRLADLRRCARLIVKERRYQDAIRQCAAACGSILQGEDPVSPLAMLARNRRRGFTSSFYVMIGGSAPQDPPPYWNRTERLTQIIRAVEEAGSEVGLHPSYEAMREERLRHEKDRFDIVRPHQAAGIRQHFIRLETPATWRAQEALGCWYDSTLYFAPQAGFRNGWCFPFHPYDIEHDRPLSLWEIPITVMDGTLRDYQRMTPEEGSAAILQLLQAVREQHGIFVMLWHTDFSWASPEWAWVYDRFLDEAIRSGAAVGSAAELLRRWEARARTAHS